MYDLTLNKEGKAYVRALKRRMESMGIYEDGDDILLLNDIGLQYQLYRKAQAEAIMDPDDKGLQMRAHRHYKNTMDMIHRLGLTPTARIKKESKQEEPEETVFDSLNRLMNDDN